MISYEQTITNTKEQLDDLDNEISVLWKEVNKKSIIIDNLLEQQEKTWTGLTDLQETIKNQKEYQTVALKSQENKIQAAQNEIERMWDINRKIDNKIFELYNNSKIRNIIYIITFIVFFILILLSFII